jgi:DNA-binding response OmpR family regulator
LLTTFGRLRRRDTPSVKILTRGPLTLDTVATRAFLRGEDVLLKPKEFALLHLLVENEGKEFTAEELYKAVWGLDANDDTRTIKVHISALRQKLQMDSQCEIELEMEQRKYYKLNITK